MAETLTIIHGQTCDVGDLAGGVATLWAQIEQSEELPLCRSLTINLIAVADAGSEPTIRSALEQDNFETDALIGAGLMRVTQRGRPFGTFACYASQRVGFLVFPYICEGRLAQLRVRPALDDAGITSARVPRWMATSGKAPCFFNHQMLEGAPRVLLVEGEIAVLAGVSHFLATDLEPWAVVGTPAWKHLRPEWCRDLVDKEVVVLVNAEKSEEVGRILGKFEKAKVRPPRVVKLPSGIRLAEFLSDNDLAG